MVERHTECHNCGLAAGPSYCPHCGQEVEARHGPLRQVLGEVLSDWLSLDSRLARSLRALLRPGRLSELYVEGKRAPFLRPFRLYLLASVVLFSSVLTLETPNAENLELYIGGQLVGEEVTGRKVGEATSVKRTLSLMEDDSLFGSFLVTLAGDRVDRLRAQPRQQIVDTLFAGFRRLLPLTLIFFVPLLALGLKLLYIRRRAKRFLYLDHLVFALHFQTVLFLLLSVLWMAARLYSPDLLAGAISVVVSTIATLFVYLPLALRRFYQQSRRWTAVKTLGVLFLYSRLLGAVIGVAALVAVWGT